MRYFRLNKIILLILLLSFPTTILFGIISTNVHAADEDIPDENYKNAWHWHADIQPDELIIYEFEMTMRNLTSGKMIVITKELRIFNITGFKNETSFYGFGNISRIYGTWNYYNCTSDEIIAYDFPWSDPHSLAGFGYNDTGFFREYYDMGVEGPSLSCTFLPVNGTKGVATVDVEIMADIINKTYLDIGYQMGWAPKFNYNETDTDKNSIYFLNTTNNWFINNTYYDNGTLQNAESSYWLKTGGSPYPIEFNSTMKHVPNYDITDEVEWGVDVGDSLYFGANSDYGGYNETKFVITGFENDVIPLEGSLMEYEPIYQCFETVLANYSYWDPALEDYTPLQENFTIGIANNYHPFTFESGIPLLMPKNTDIKDIDFFYNNYSNDVYGGNFPFDEVYTKFENGKNMLIGSHSTEDAKMKMIYNKTTGICDLFYVEVMGYIQALYRKNMTTITNQAEADSILLYSDLVDNNKIYMNFTYIPGEDFDLYWANLPVNPTLVEFEYEIYNMPLYADVYMNNSNYRYQGPINVTLYYDDSLLSADMEENLAPFYLDTINEKWIEAPEIQVILDTDANMIVIVGLEYVDLTVPQYFALGVKEWTWGVDIDDIMPFEVSLEAFNFDTGEREGGFLDFWIFNISSIDDVTKFWFGEPHQTFSQVNFTSMYYNHSLGKLVWNPNDWFEFPSALMEFCVNDSSMFPLKFGEQNPLCFKVPFILPLRFGNLNLTSLGPILNETFFEINSFTPKWNIIIPDDDLNTLFFYNTSGYYMDLSYYENGTLKDADIFFSLMDTYVYNITITRSDSYNVTSDVKWSVKAGDELYFGDMYKEIKVTIVEINETAVNMYDIYALPYERIMTFSNVWADIYYWNSTHEYWMYQYTSIIGAANNLYPYGPGDYHGGLGIERVWPILLIPTGIEGYEMYNVMRFMMNEMRVDTLAGIGANYVYFTNSTGPNYVYFMWNESTGVVKLFYGILYNPSEGKEDYFAIFEKHKVELDLGSNIVILDNYFVPDITLTVNITTNAGGCEFYYAILDINPTNESLPTGTPMFYGDMMINDHTLLADNFTIEVKLLTINLADIYLHLHGWIMGDWLTMPEETMDDILTYNYIENSVTAEMDSGYPFYSIGAWSYTLKAPGNFTLSSTAEKPDDDGDFTLTWGLSSRATSYSVYEYSSYINETNIISATLLAAGLTTPLFPLTGYTDGTYYFIVMAYNAAGGTLSNCHEVIVEIPAEEEEPPGSFTLSSNAGSPDDDGSFTLSWTAADGATSYTVYAYSSYITEINSSLTILAEDVTSRTLPQSEYTDGTYYFIVVASNNIGDTLSNCHEVVVDIPGRGGPTIPGYNIYLISLLFFVGTVIIIRKTRKKLP